MVSEQEADADVAGEAEKEWPRLDPVRTGIRGSCPRCGEGHLFQSFLKLAKGCDVCGLSYAFADPADGPAFFVIIFGCVPAVTFALLLEIAWTPPLWVHLATSVPLLIVTCVLPLRPLKGWLVCNQFFFKAREGRISEPWYPYGADGPAVPPSQHPW